MPGYVIVETIISDPVAFEKYKAAVPATVEKFGGRYLVRGGAVTVTEGDWKPERIVVLEFPGVAEAKQWLASTEYGQARQHRVGAARFNMVIVEG